MDSYIGLTVRRYHSLKSRSINCLFCVVFLRRSCLFLNFVDCFDTTHNMLTPFDALLCR